jgi:hypothetical protein
MKKPTCWKPWETMGYQKMRLGAVQPEIRYCSLGCGYQSVVSEESNGFVTSEKGGACVCVTKNFIFIGTFSTDHKMQNGVAQNPGELNKRVETLAKDMISKGSLLALSLDLIN